ncbi:sialoadhesin-like [Clarias gariepinus]|uniref:sialoadhesin-like n=1 Tax=Clarias gariepinus TaxID=13013 RepID=UPI00234D927D|nr:sialoadhesin-like [Clarias gariepinus]
MMFLKTAYRNLLCLIFLFIITGALGNRWSVTYSQEHLCALKGSTVFMNGSYTHPADFTVNKAFWVINPVWGKESTDLSTVSGYSGRVEYLRDEQKHFSLRLSDVKKTDEHQYIIRVLGQKMQKVDTYFFLPGVKLNVTDLQVFAPAEVTEGQSAVLICKTTCSLTDPTFIWYKTSRDLTTNTIKSNEVHLQSVSSEDAGSYSCAVRGYEHLPSPAHTLRVRYPPKNVSVSISPSGEIVEDSLVTLTCSSDANPPVENYTWFKVNEPSAVGSGQSYRALQSGQYYCEAQNKHGSERSAAVSVTLHVLYPPKNVSVSISPSGEIVEGSSVTLTCSSDANPPVKNYTWFKVNESPSVGSEQSYSFILSSRSRGQYYCEAQNKHGSERSAAVSVTLHVLYSPKNVSVSISPSGEIVEDSSETLTCSSDANPPVEIYTWFKEKTSIGKGKTYTISNISSEDSGEYKCKCSNEVGHQNSSSVTLNVLYRPKNVSVSISPSGEIVEDSSVTLTCSSDANPPLEIYTWFKVNEFSSVGSGQSYRALQSGQYYCETQNKHGSERSAAVSVTLHVLYPPKNVSVSISPSGEIVEDSSVTLTCSSDANPPVEIYTWFKEMTSIGNEKTYTISNISSEDSGEYKCRCSNEVGHQDSSSVTLNVLYRPKNVFVSISPSCEIVEGSSVTLTCSSDANPPVEIYTWFKVNEFSAVGSRQSYRALQSGQYYCEAQNKHGSERSAAVSVTLNVLYPPKNVSVSISPSGEIVEDSSVTLTCSSDANPPVEIYTWFKEMTSIGNEKTYTISNISSEDSGEYKCRCSNEVGHQDSSSVTLNVLYRPKNVFVSISPSCEIVEGSSVTLTCSSDANPPVEIYTWFKVNEFSAVGSRQSYRALQSGQYYCEAQNKHGSERSAAMNMNMLYPPKNVSVSISPSGVIVEGSSVTLTCSSDANPPVEIYTWFKMNESSAVGSGQSYRALQSGQYYCEAQNKHGSERSAALTLSINYPPKNVSVSISPSGEIVEGSSVTLTCSSDANPPVEIYTWFKDTCMTSIGNEKTYTISDISSEDSGEYKCKCSNGVGHQDSSSVSLNVLYSPKNVSVSISPSIEIVEGSSVTLTCSSDANPPVENYTWFKDMTSVGKEKTYNISKISSEDSGEYKCKCSNEVGHQESSSVTLNVLYHPKNVSVSISPSGEMVEGSSVTLTCSSDANPPVENYTWFKDMTSIGKEKTYNISKISSEDSGEYKCKCSNEVGHQESSSVTLNVLYHPKNVSVSISPSGEMVEGGSVTLTCSSDANPPVENYTWFKDMTSVGKEKTYNISKISSEDSGEYKCKCSNEVGHQESNSVTLNVLYLQVIAPAEVTEGQSAVLTCKTTCSLTDPTFIWYKTSRDLTTNTIKSNKVHLQSVSSEDAGSYSCAVRGYEHLPSPAHTLRVRYSPKKVSVSISPSGEIVEDSSVTLTCSSDANPPVEIYTWFKEMISVGKGRTYTISKISSEDSGEYKCKCNHPKNVLVSISPSGEIVEGSSVTLTCSSDANPPVEIYTWFKDMTSVEKGRTYTISNISSEDSGEYKCKCSNEVGHQESSSVTLNVLYRPKNVSVSISPSGEIVESSSVTLTCSSDANPPVGTYTWFRGRKSIGKGKTYTISNISSKDSGEYKCKCSNEVGHQDSSSVTLNVLYHPKNVSVSISPSGEIVEGSSVTLTCSGDANPPVENYTWFKDMTSIGKGRTYTISKISSEDSGEYKCKCSNEVGSQESSSVTLNVLYRPKNVSVSISSSGEIVEGISVTLTCSSDANPPVEIYTWFKVNESSAVGSGQSYRALQSGQYYCEAQNKHGSERSAAVSVTLNARRSSNAWSTSPSSERATWMAVSEVQCRNLKRAAPLRLPLFARAGPVREGFPPPPRWKRQKKKADAGDYQNAGPSDKDDTYAALDPTGRTSDDVYHTLTQGVGLRH